jgi:hypothetical protein
MVRGLEVRRKGNIDQGAFCSRPLLSHCRRVKLGPVSCPGSSPQWLGPATGLQPTVLCACWPFSKTSSSGETKTQFLIWRLARYIYLQTFCIFVYIFCQNLHLA